MTIENMNTYSRYYFLGIGGIGMSAIARYFNTKGFAVAGYDRTDTALTQSLTSEGIGVDYNEAVSSIPSKFLDIEKTLIIITPAIPVDHPQWIYFKDHHFRIMKRSEMLGEITRHSKAICIAGTHGKTTTATITAHLLHQSHVGCNAFLGGISNNYNTNLLLSNDSNFVVVEADEYDRSFHQLQPYMAVITSSDPDHLDIYGTEKAFYESFEHFTSLVSKGGALLINTKANIHPRLQSGVKLFTYGMSGDADFYAKNIRIKNATITFDFVTPTETIYDTRLGVPIMINVENCVAAMAMAWLSGVDTEEIRTGISTYSGIYRRFNTVYKSEKTVYIDDYAHHPSELRASISSIRQLYPSRKITGIFQPHLYTRTRDFATDFAKELSALDELILLDIYPAREKPIDGITSEIILNKVTLSKKTLVSKEKLLENLGSKNLDILITFGAGDIDKLVPIIQKYLQNKNKK